MNCTDQAIRFRLEALSCPFLSTLDLQAPLQLQKLIVWLEDTHIRLLPPNQRAPLCYSPFLPALLSYLSHLPPPHPPTPPPLLPTTGYLIDLALRCHYSDNASLYNTPHDPWYGCSIPVLPNCSSSPEVLTALTRLLKSLAISEPPPNALAAAQMAAMVIENCLTDEIHSGRHSSSETASNGSPQQDPLDALPLGFTTGDAHVDRFAKVARLLHVRQMRQLQDEFNDSVAKMQQITANPKTDARLGKVGR